MTPPEIAQAFAFLLAAGAVGMMVFFGAAVAPSVFRTLDRPVAGELMRVLFPKYYLALASTSLLAAVLSLAVSAFAALLLALAGLGFVWARLQLAPKIDGLRVAALAGEANAQAEFARLHRLSVRLNAVQLVLMLAGAARLAVG